MGMCAGTSEVKENDMAKVDQLVTKDNIDQKQAAQDVETNVGCGSGGGGSNVGRGYN